MRRDIEFNAEGVCLRGWLYTPDYPTVSMPGVVMAHGFSAVKEILRAHLAHGIPGADALLLDVAVGLFDTEDARGGIKAFLESGSADAAFAGR